MDRFGVSGRGENESLSLVGKEEEVEKHLPVDSSSFAELRFEMIDLIPSIVPFLVRRSG